MQAEPETQKNGEKFVRGRRTRLSSTPATTEREAARLFGTFNGNAFLLEANGTMTTYHYLGSEKRLTVSPGVLCCTVTKLGLSA